MEQSVKNAAKKLRREGVDPQVKANMPEIIEPHIHPRSQRPEDVS